MEVMKWECPECFDSGEMPYNTPEEKTKADKVKYCGNCDIGEVRIIKIITEVS